MITVDGNYLDCLTANSSCQGLYWAFRQEYSICEGTSQEVATTLPGEDTGLDISETRQKASEV